MSQFLVVIGQVFTHYVFFLFYDELKGQSYNDRSGVEKYYGQTDLEYENRRPSNLLHEWHCGKSGSIIYIDSCVLDNVVLDLNPTPQ